MPPRADAPTRLSGRDCFQVDPWRHVVQVDLSGVQPTPPAVHVCLTVQLSSQEASGSHVVAQVLGEAGSLELSDERPAGQSPSQVRFSGRLCIPTRRCFVLLQSNAGWESVEATAPHGLQVTLSRPHASELPCVVDHDCYYDKAGGRWVWDVRPCRDDEHNLNLVGYCRLEAGTICGPAHAGIVVPEGDAAVTAPCDASDGLLVFRRPLHLAVDPRCRGDPAGSGKPWEEAACRAAHRVSMAFVALPLDAVPTSLVLFGGGGVRNVTMAKRDQPGCGPWFAPKLRYHAMAVTGTDVSPFPKDELMAAYHEIVVKKFPRGHGGTFVTLSGIGGYLGLALAEPNVVFSRWNERGRAPTETLLIGQGSHRRTFGHEGSGQQLKHAVTARVGDTVCLLVSRRDNSPTSDVTAWFRVGRGGPWQLVGTIRKNVSKFEPGSFIEHAGRGDGHLHCRQALFANKWHWNFSGDAAPVQRSRFTVKDDVGRVEAVDSGVLLTIGGRLACSYEHSRREIVTSPGPRPQLPEGLCPPG